MTYPLPPRFLLLAVLWLSLWPVPRLVLDVPDAWFVC